MVKCKMTKGFFKRNLETTISFPHETQKKKGKYEVFPRPGVDFVTGNTSLPGALVISKAR
jgi:hypothetical protein